MCKKKWNGSAIVGTVFVVLGISNLVVSGAIAASSCQQDPVEDTKCNGAYVTTPSAHSGDHECTGSTFTGIAHNGSCDGEQSGNCCDLGDASINVKVYGCQDDGSGGCTHTYIEKKDKDVCDC